MMDKIINKLKEYADWAKANEWEVPICLSDDLYKTIELLTFVKNVKEICFKRAQENYRYSCELNDDYIKGVATGYDAVFNMINIALSGKNPQQYFK